MSRCPLFLPVLFHTPADMNGRGRPKCRIDLDVRVGRRGSRFHDPPTPEHPWRPHRVVSIAGSPRTRDPSRHERTANTTIDPWPCACLHCARSWLLSRLRPGPCVSYPLRARSGFCASRTGFIPSPGTTPFFSLPFPFLSCSRSGGLAPAVAFPSRRNAPREKN